jgi:excisionase family DNA binding protein
MEGRSIDIADKSLTGGRRESASTSGTEPTARDSADRPLLSPTDLAAYLAVPLATVYRWRSRRKGPCGIRVGRHVRYRIADVERWLDDQRERRS